MTTIYRPAPIKSVEQAEALDGKVVFLMSLRRTGEVYASCLHEDMTPGSWPERLEKPRRWDWTALVPIEAVEETARDISPEVGAYGPDDEIPEHYLGPARSRYVTPWEEA